MVVSENTVEFWYEFSSPYSYISAMRAEQLARDSGLILAWRPFLLGPIFASQGWDTSPFNIYEAKGRYMWRDVARLCDKYALEFLKPAVFPLTSVLAARVAHLAEGEGWCPGFSRAVFRDAFTTNTDISSEHVIASIISAMGRSAEEVLERCREEGMRAAFRAQTTRAGELGIFGAPTFVVGEGAGRELFWGNDRLEDALAWAVDMRGGI